MATVNKDRFPLNPAILVWARDRAGYSVKDAAKRVGTSPERVQDWEAGSRSPTIRQGRALAKLYDRPFLEFFALEIPEVPEIELVPDFLMFSGSSPSETEIRELLGIQAWAEEQRANALGLIEDLGEQPPVLSDNLRFDLEFDPSIAASIAREAMRFSSEEQLHLSARERNLIPARLRDRIESMGVLALRQNGLTKLRARGICLYAEPLPVIIFGGEAPSAQAFTLAHEFGHVLTATSAISGGPSAQVQSISTEQRTEEWCNTFASAFLVPSDWLQQYEPAPAEPQSSFDTHRLAELSRIFGISRHAMMVRLVRLGYVSPDFYWNTMRPIFLAEEANFKAHGRPKYYGRRYVSSKGNFYTGLVLEAWGAGAITSHNAAEFMGINKLAHLKDIREDFRA